MMIDAGVAKTADSHVDSSTLKTLVCVMVSYSNLLSKLYQIYLPDNKVKETQKFNFVCFDLFYTGIPCTLF
jgi:hypothetical protein